MTGTAASRSSFCPSIFLSESCLSTGDRYGCGMIDITGISATVRPSITTGTLSARVKTSLHYTQPPLEIVPHAGGDKALVLIVELPLETVAVEIFDAGAKRVAGAAAPLPAGLGGDVAAVVQVLKDLRVDCGEWRAPESIGLRGTVVDAELEFPRPRAAVLVKGPIRFAVEPQIGDRTIGHAEHQLLALRS